MTQTFMISPNFAETAHCLDNRRLNKQIVEAFQVYRYLIGDCEMQGNPHPYRIWKGYEKALIAYIVALHDEWIERYDRGLRGGKRCHKNGMEAERISIQKSFFSNYKDPDWINSEEVLSSHRAALLYKDYTWYSQFGWKEQPAIPTKINKNGSVSLPYFWRDTEVK